MNALVISGAAAALMLGGACVGILLRRHLPQHHLNDHSKDVVRLGSGLVATITALVLGLLITSAKNTYDMQRQEIRQIAEKLVLQDNQLKRYGPEARHARELQRQAVPALIGRIWGQRAVQSSTGAPYQPGMEGDLVFSAIEALAPQNDVQRNLKFRALATTSAITEARVLLFEEADAGLPAALLVVVIFWLTMLFAGFTLFSPINMTSATVLAIIALSASGAIFLILELNHPFSGLMQISSVPFETRSACSVPDRQPQKIPAASPAAIAAPSSSHCSTKAGCQGPLQISGSWTARQRRPVRMVSTPRRVPVPSLPARI